MQPFLIPNIIAYPNKEEKKTSTFNKSNDKPKGKPVCNIKKARASEETIQKEFDTE
jgi:hypothetical protein